MRVPFLPQELHRSPRASTTAQWTTLGRALELRREPTERIVSDPFAPRFLSATGRQLVQGAAAASFAVDLVERSELTAIGTSALCRHRFIDAHLLESLPEVDQVIVLGAGYDSRAYRFARAIGDRRTYEVDLPPLSQRKAAIVAADPDTFRSRTVVRVETNFRSASLRSTLIAAGVRLGAPTFVAWEGVSMYLDRAAVEQTLADLAVVCGRGSVLAMDFWQRVPLRRPLDQYRRAAAGSLRLIGEPIRCALVPGAAVELLAAAGFRTVDLAPANRMTSRFATGGRRCDESMYVVASTC